MLDRKSDRDGSLWPRINDDDPPDVEQVVLGAMIVDNGLLEAAYADLEPHHFAEPLHRQLFGLMSDMIRQGREADPVTLRAALPPNVIIAPGGLTVPKYIARLAAHAPRNLPSERIRRYAREISLLWQKRDLIARLEDVQVTGEPADFITALSDAITAIEASCSAAKTNADGFLAFWHGDVATTESRAWLVYGTIPETGCGLLSGQWGTYKTFTAIELACAVMSGTCILDCDIDRPGGALLYAAEGEGEVAIRLQASLENRCPHMAAPGKAPFAWLTPEKLTLTLLDPASVKAFIARAKAISAEMMKRFGVPLVLIEIDTVVATAGFKKSGDEDDAVLGAQMVEAMKEISRATGAFVLGVDHFGKAAETGTRGTSAKESGVDVVLATLGERSINGVVTNPRLAVRKVRGGVVGREYPFTIKTADMQAVDSKGRTVSTLKIIWSAETIAGADGTKEKKDPWLKSMSSRLLRKVLMNLIPDCGKDMRPYPDGPTVRAIDKEVIRKEFYKEYPAEGDTPKQKAEAKKKAFKRAIEDAHKAILIVTREIDDIQHVWLVEGDKGDTGDNVPFVPDVPPLGGDTA
jgi:AAA domain/DnaB-like helicase N terminal domain